MKITEEHIKLLAGLTEYLECEENFGWVPRFDAKRPFGNSGGRVGYDAAELLDLDPSELNREYALQVLYECTPVLKAILRSPEMQQLVGIEVPE